MPTITFSQFGIFSACVVVALGIAVAIKMLFHRDPPFHKEYVTKTDHDRDFKILHDDLTKGARSRKEMHEAQELQGREIAGLKKETEHQTRQLTNLDGKIDRILERLPR